MIGAGRHGDGDGDAGSATVWAALVSGVILAVGLVGVDLASGVRARHVAESAADLSALAAAGRTVDGAETACRVARGVAAHSGAVVSRCRLDGWDALVETEVDRPWTVLGRGPAGARARAGPAPVEVTRPDRMVR
ncbi:Rv3654c family TadE-like protein [Pseudonocardia sp. KRD291]|uniref:Rv3654c family TadE-like protein n=1 Tax=Pseudonocardia sp. KRD291 TaxID=2792007 RepID=UPI001C49D4CB|nr:Rv3654c family TadE-like protein [Pseudonocardia sp. KRD291]MBW0101926.1 flp pilus-assembly TadE/G-like family protein [Pseudonocardia sp. KRD291]